MSSPSSVFCSFPIYLTVVLADRWYMGSGVCEVSDCSPSVFLLFLALFLADDGKGQLRKAEVWFGCSQREDEERSQGGRSVKCTVKIGVHSGMPPTPSHSCHSLVFIIWTKRTVLVCALQAIHRIRKPSTCIISMHAPIYMYKQGRTYSRLDYSIA